jgi:diguanylate cyclase (GGDEF)-like protein
MSRVATSRALLACAATTGAGLLLFAMNLLAPVGPRWLLWLPTVATAPVMVVAFWHAAATRTLPEPTRRFWRRLVAAGCLVGAGSIAQAADVVSDPYTGGPRTGPVMLAFHGVAVVIIVYSLYRLPLGSRVPGDRVRIALDAAIVTLASGVFIWHFATRPALGSHDRNVQVASLVVIVLALVAILGVAKLVLSSHAYIDASALRLLAGAMLVGAAFPLQWPMFDDRWPHLFPTQAGMPVIYLLATWAAERQRTTGTGSTVRVNHAAEARRRTFSLLPYAAVAATDGLLVAVTWSGGFHDRAEVRVVVAVAVGLTTLVIVRQITVLRDNSRLVTRLDHSATHDALTGLPNRVLFHRRLAAALSRPDEHRVSVALVDLDDFKEVNDTLGHDIGDLLLTTVSERFLRCVDPADTVARLGGDEFVVVIDGADPHAADRTAERMITALREPVVAGGHTLAVRASIGIADGRGGDDPSVLLRHADIAMYGAKKLPGTAYLRHRDLATVLTG